MSPLRLLRLPRRTWPAEHSVALRAVSAGAVCVGIAACSAQGELPLWFAVIAAVLVVAGGAFSYRRRTRPLPYLKLLLGAAMLGAFAWFFVTVSSDAASGQLSTVETPLAVLFTAMQAAHAFDMPSRRDLGFSLAGSATLLAVAGAQAIDLSFAAYVVLWAVFALAGLHASWSSMSGGTPPRPLPVLASTAAALLVAALFVVFLPAPRVPGLVLADFGASAAASTTATPRVVPAPRTAGQRPASANGLTGVGGFLGFAGPLDTALRPGLGDEVVLRVRADRPTYWVAETFDSWSGRSWTATGSKSSATSGSTSESPDLGGTSVLRGGPPFVVTPGEVLQPNSGRASNRTLTLGGVGVVAQPDYQTFYLAAPTSDLVLHADQATAVWIPTRRLYIGADDTIGTKEALGAGSIYSVESTVATPSDTELAKTNGVTGLAPVQVREDLQLPHRYPKVAALARRITSRDTTVISKILSLEDWMGSHTRYTLDIPPLGPGQDTVNEFLFGTRRGFCEQISTSLAVMLRTLGIPAREAVGYVPGTYDPITGVYDEQAKDAHAWVQVWFPGYGWQSFDPTAYVAAANPSTASTIGHDLMAALRRVPVLPTVAVVTLLVLAALLVAWRKRRPRTWSAKVTRELERAAHHAGVRSEPAATLGALAAALDARLGAQPAPATSVDTTSGPATAAASAIAAPAVHDEGESPARCRAEELAAAAAAAAWGDGDSGRRAGRYYVHEARRIRRRARHRARR